MAKYCSARWGEKRVGLPQKDNPTAIGSVVYYFWLRAA